MAQEISIKNKNGFTLLELLVALVIIMISMMALLVSINLAISSNLDNELRQQAVGLGEDTLNEIKKLPFDNIKGNVIGQQRQLSLRGSQRLYLITTEITDFPPDTKRVAVGVSWTKKGNNYEHTVATTVTRPIGTIE